MIKVLHILSSLDMGGVERLLYDYCIRMPEDIKFDFAVCDYKPEGVLEKLLVDRGSKVFHFPQLHQGVSKSIKELSKIISTGNYDIVHAHTAYRAFPAIFAAWKCGVRVRIAHSHTTCQAETKTQMLQRKLFSFLTRVFSTNLFACGESAGIRVWGKNAEFYLMCNAVNVDDFRFSENKRSTLREQFGLQNKLVLGSVARFCFEKNHGFMLDILKEFKKMPMQDTVLVLVGSGELEQEIRAKVEKLDLCDSVIFLGTRNDVSDLLNMFDIFMLPSLSEGLPVSLVEVQANGLPAVVSDSVTAEVKILDNIKYVSLASPIDEWTANICVLQRFDAEQALVLVRNAGYDINIEVIALYKKYNELLMN